MVNIGNLKGQILEIVKSEGPVLPVAISRKLGSDTYFAGAILSELVGSKDIKITSAKIGGSPLYYVNGQEGKLDKLYSFLPDREKEAYELLRTRQVLRDRECDPAIRVALRTVKDFAFPLEINGELYWKWYLTSEDDAKGLIGDVKKVEMAKKVETQKPLIKPTKIKPLETHEVVVEKRQVVKEDNFMDLVVNSLKIKNIHVAETNVVRKNREIDGKIKINSDLGVLEYYLLAKNKKSLNEADLSLANDRGRKNKLPVLFLSNGNLSKKAERYLEENLKGRVIFRKI